MPSTRETPLYPWSSQSSGGNRYQTNVELSIKNYKYCRPKNGMKEPKIEGRKPSQEGTIVQVRNNKDLDKGRGMEKSRF